MKTKMLAAALAVIAFSACNQKESRFLDLNTGENVMLVRDENTGLMVDSVTRKPVTIYVDREKNDTIWGASGKVVNGHVTKADDGKWIVKGEGDEWKAKSDDAKIKNEDGDYKRKDDDYKKKVEKDGDVKIKDGDKTIKIDGKTGERKVSYD